MDEGHNALQSSLGERMQGQQSLEQTTAKHAEVQRDLDVKIGITESALSTRLDKLEQALRQQDEALHKECNDRIDGVERHHSNVAKENTKRLNALDLRISGLQGASGEARRDINKLRDEVNSLTVKSAAQDVDCSKSSDDLRKLERQRADDSARHKQDLDA